MARPRIAGETVYIAFGRLHVLTLDRLCRDSGLTRQEIIRSLIADQVSQLDRKNLAKETEGNADDDAI